MTIRRKVVASLSLAAAIFTLLGSGSALQGCHKDATLEQAPPPKPGAVAEPPAKDKHLPGANTPSQTP
jgi:hypothetical protein